jgi:hypothetical protein
MQKRSFFAPAIAFAGIVILSGASVALAAPREAQRMMHNNNYQLQSGSSSYAFAPQSVGANSRYGQCWIATDANRPFGYMDSCANPLAYDPALNPAYDATLHGD